MRNWDNLGQFQDRADIINAYDSDIAYDVIINTTPNTPQNDLFQQIRKISQTSIAYDMIYTAKQTLFLRTMEKLYPNVIQANGIGMLIHQARVAFHTVFGITPEVERLYPMLQAQFR
jgi:shikimate 5-dehydrogenase